MHPDISIGQELGYELSLVNSWQQGSKYCYQFSLTLTNATEASLDTWEASLCFPGEITLLNGWNGTYSAEGATLTITPASYNAVVECGGSVRDIGFIIEVGGAQE